MNDIDAIRARADAATASFLGADASHAFRAVFDSASDVPALLALVDAQAARIDKALGRHVVSAICDRCVHCERLWPCPTYLALTQDAQ